MDHRAMNVAQREQLRAALRTVSHEEGSVTALNPVYMTRDTSFTDNPPLAGFIDAVASVPVHY